MAKRERSRPATRGLLAAAIAAVIGVQILIAGAFAQTDAVIPGEHRVVVTKEDAPDGLPNGEMVVGAWRLAFLEDGAYEAERLDVGVLVSGTWELDGDEVTITDQTGVLSCTEAANNGDSIGDVSVGVYTLVEEDNSAHFEVVEDGCAMRVVLFTASPLAPYVACPVTVAGVEALDGGPAAAYTPSDEATIGPVENQLDRFLAELTSCWSTGDPQRFLPLLSDEYRPTFLSMGTDSSGDPSEQAQALASSMGIDFTFERAGNVREVRENEATCIVRTVIGGQESLERYRFLLIDGAWYWDGPA